MMNDVERDNAGEVLVVEDTPASLKLLADLLGNAGYAVRQAPDGELALWSAQSRPPELILLDVRMPGIDGLEVCRRLKQSPTLCDIPVIFLSAQYDTDDKVRGFQAGAVDFIGKPYQAEEVLARTRAHIGLARSQLALSGANAELTATLAQLRSARDELLRSERLAALGAMVAGVAHELNTPIGNSVLAASTLEERARDFAGRVANGLRRSDLERFVAETLQASGLLLRNLAKSAELITSFKQVATDQAGSLRRRFDLAQLLEDMSITLAPQLRERPVSLRVEVAPGIEMDTFPGALCQAFSQLVLNAMLHGFGDGRAGSIVVQAGAIDGARVRMTFADDGSGIAPEHLVKVFDPFFTTRLGQGSCGLGLHIVHNLVSNVLGGAIEVASAAGRTCFTLEFPRTAPALVAAESPAQRHPQAR
ncbi:MAG: hybrid sensor histidine kinase/response regulator [Pseudomonadota bacterium]